MENLTGAIALRKIALEKPVRIGARRSWSHENHGGD
jgi:hypothetical protein